jgi:hypothetical protein
LLANLRFIKPNMPDARVRSKMIVLRAGHQHPAPDPDAVDVHVLAAAI